MAGVLWEILNQVQDDGRTQGVGCDGEMLKQVQHDKGEAGVVASSFLFLSLSLLLRRVVRVVSSLSFSLPLSLSPSFLLRREVQRIGFLLIFVAKFKGGYCYEEIVLLDR
jgi:hypothetical protein